ncbi:hypothetical protein [Komarekiella delphini-convector]|nr:hypothetical protein [Komarekiella delphini-convector]
MSLTQFWHFSECDRLISSANFWSLIDKLLVLLQPVAEMLPKV